MPNKHGCFYGADSKIYRNRQHGLTKIRNYIDT